MLDWQITLISQFANSNVLLAILEAFNECVDQTANFNAFYNNMWDVLTATGYGLDVWGRIVGVSRNLQVQSGLINLGFAQQLSTVDAFGPGGQGPFYSGAGATNNYTMTDATYRQVILAKALYNICDGSIPSINTLLMTLFPGEGNCYCTDGGGMTMTFTFDFAPTPVQLAIIYQSGVLPKPVGVAATIVHM